ncbi:MAG: hypothetical protein ACYSW8_21545 [Planctomycetota bacterium]
MPNSIPNRNPAAPFGVPGNAVAPNVAPASRGVGKQTVHRSPHRSVENPNAVLGVNTQTYQAMIQRRTRLM